VAAESYVNAHSNEKSTAAGGLLRILGISLSFLMALWRTSTHRAKKEGKNDKADL